MTKSITITPKALDLFKSLIRWKFDQCDSDQAELLLSEIKELNMAKLDELIEDMESDMETERANYRAKQDAYREHEESSI